MQFQHCQKWHVSAHAIGISIVKYWLCTLPWLFCAWPSKHHQRKNTSLAVQCNISQQQRYTRKKIFNAHIYWQFYQNYNASGSKVNVERQRWRKLQRKSATSHRTDFDPQRPRAKIVWLAGVLNDHAKDQEMKCKQLSGKIHVACPRLHTVVLTFVLSCSFSTQWLM